MVEGVLLRMILIGVGAALTVASIVVTAIAPAAATVVPTLVIAAASAGAIGLHDRAALRAVELALFAGAAAMLVGSAYVLAEPDSAATVWRDAALVGAVLAFAYGALVPNTLPRAAVGIVALAAAPLVLLGLWREHAPDAYTAVIDGGIAGLLAILGVAALVAIASHAHMTAFLRVTVRARDEDMYQLLDKIGAGGMGEIWRARHRRLSRTAAIKLIRPDKLCADPAVAKNAICRFELEAKSTASLRSVNTVEVYDFGTTKNGTFYYVMEYLDGLDLSALVDRVGPLPADRVLFLLEQVCHSLSDAHANGLVHRDIKPANIFVSRMGSTHDHIKVLDFGLALPVERSEATQLSKTDQIIGTPAYMAPELIHGETSVDCRADIYAIGCVAYHALTGELVFDAANALAAAVAHATEPPVPPSKRTANPVPADLEAIVLRCLEKSPDARFADCESLRKALIQCADYGRWTADTARDWWRGHASVERTADRPRNSDAA